MTGPRVKAHLQLLVGMTMLAFDPAKVADDLDLPPDPPVEGDADVIALGTSDKGPILEPHHRAVNGFIRVTHFAGDVVEYYVGHQPGFIAKQLAAAKASGTPLFYYWDKPGYKDAQRIAIAPALVRNIEVRYLEADVDSLIESEMSWAL